VLGRRLVVEVGFGEHPNVGTNLGHALSLRRRDLPAPGFGSFNIPGGDAQWRQVATGRTLTDEFSDDLDGHTTAHVLHQCAAHGASTIPLVAQYPQLAAGAIHLLDGEPTGER
jgi:hypothetical protein